MNYMGSEVLVPIRTEAPFIKKAQKHAIPLQYTIRKKQEVSRRMADVTFRFPDDSLYRSSSLKIVKIWIRH